MAIETFLYVLWEEPLVCVICTGRPMAAGVELALALAGGRACHILVRPTWAVSVMADQIATAAHRLRTEQPLARLVAMTPTGEDADLLRGLGVEALWAHNSAFIDERIYYPEPGAPKLYDAVHTAQTKPFKRHDLAYGVPNLALISYAERAGEPSVADLVMRYRGLSYANWSPEAGAENLAPEAVRGVVSRAHCGLLLSEVEGPNNASMEYFLCGVPLVTTAAQGGREAMYDPRYVVVVEPLASAVEAAVWRFRSSAPDPDDVRRGALAKALPHRRRMIDWLSATVGTDLTAQADVNGWLPQFRDKLRQKWSLERRPDGSLAAHSLAETGMPTLKEA